MSGKRAKAKRKATETKLAPVVDMAPRSGPVSTLELVESIMCWEGTYATEAWIPPHGVTGRPRAYPDYMYLVYHLLVSVYGSARKVETELSHPLLWRHMRNISKRRFPDDPSMQLPGQAIRRHHYRHALTYFRNEERLADLLEGFREGALAIALELGLLDPKGPGSPTHPDLSRTIQADGKVVTPTFRAKPGDTRIDKETGEVVARRADPDGHLFKEGTGEWVHGSKYVLASARTEESRLVLDLDYVAPKDVGGEAGVATRMLVALAARAPGIQAVNYDAAMRGEHVNALIRAGLVPVVPVGAASVQKKGNKVLAKKVKDKLIEVREIKVAGKPVTIHLHAVNGQLCLREVNDTGGSEFTALKRARTQVPKNVDGTSRMYTQYQLPKHLGGSVISVANHITDEDRKRGLNRTEYLRPIPHGDPDYARLYARRKDVESLNRALEDTLYLNRAHSVGHVAQLVDLIGFAIMTNAVALHRHRRRRRAEAAA